MCKYIYSKNNYSSNLGKSCSLYKIEKTINTILPLDKNGLCFFHSDEEAFRNKFVFENLFNKTISFLKENNVNSYDFSEIKVGSNGMEDLGNRLFQPKQIHLQDCEFEAEIDFSNSFFYSSIIFEEINTLHPISFNYVSARSIEFKSGTLNKVDFSYAKISSSLSFLKNLKIEGSFLFYDSDFDEKSAIIIKDCIFNEKIGFFNSDLFTIIIQNSTFNKKLYFEQTIIKGNFDWENITLKESLNIFNCDIIPDIDYNPGEKSPISIKNIKCPNNVIINFKGKTPFGLFFDEVDIFFNNSDFKGTWNFRDSNLNQLTSNSKDKLYSLISSNKVNIGNGCRKYNNTVKKIIFLNSKEQNLAIELSMTYSNYFTNANGVQLGVEIGKRTSEFVTLIYFSDESITKKEFIERLSFSEKHFWSVLGNQPVDTLTVNDITNINDTLIDIMGTFFKLGLRMSTKNLNTDSLKAIIDAVKFNNQPVIIIENLKELIINKYSQKTLFSLNSTQVMGNDINHNEN